jgi:hypothetical protein
VKAGGDGVRAESAIALVGWAGAFRIKPGRCSCDDGGAVSAFADLDAADPAVFGVFGGSDGTDVQEGLGFLEILPRGGFAEGGFVEGGHGAMQADGGVRGKAKSRFFALSACFVGRRDATRLLRFSINHPKSGG